MKGSMALAGYLGVLVIAALFLAEVSLQEEYVLFLLTILCVLLF